MAQAALSQAAFQTAYPSAEPLRRAPPRITYVETAYDPVIRTRAPYPSAMRRARRRARLTALISLTAMTLAGWAVLSHPQGPARYDEQTAAATEAAPALSPDAPVRPVARSAASKPSIAWMLDPSPALGSGTATAFGSEAPPTPAFQVAVAEPSPAVREIARQVARAEQIKVDQARAAQIRVAQAKAAEKAAEAPVRVAAEPTPAALAPASVLVPLPVARPAELRRQPAVPPTRVAARALPRTRDVFRAAMAEEPSFFEKLFGVGGAAPSQDNRQEPRQALAYASPDALPREAPRTRVSPAPESVAGTAVYDISARTVTLPSGEVLEAHSGLGEAMDNPRFVHLRMRGSTPPGTYDLTERERLFHGVRAIRLNPVGGSAAIHGRDGLLAHTYMLRQPGASNGCVSFRDYNRFLQAFLRGEVRRLVVVAGSTGDFFGRIGMSERGGRRG
ncbi:hypothetical protein GOFOIKOB_2172 [Methylobacterium tardum]|uniref:Tlde1 domain-containing protein n=1 Tax=Methylobacterium tardum TaxID=374432 RepID=A0AA37TRI1_9HYPH|nr:tlde1 domain-containing protein [Methylobacterium tardum]URD38641.1 DUF2778 domain-containing protein [Methylobacterium tardum]GJE49138.1 hypothetical protein GOFOIKOB_2172 [Methylobacterium tardum]GLS74387.1 hypothetical protein GCM10007890_64050 [Methylobacterium tardum]